MPSCDQQPLGAYVDGELSIEERARVEAHLRECAACAREVALIREAGRRLAEYPFEDISPRELDNLHRAVADASDDGRVMRIGGTVGVIAASILIVGVAWLRSLPAPSAQPGQTIASAPVEPWEKTAMTLRADPVFTNDADWMLQRLAMGGQP